MADELLVERLAAVRERLAGAAARSGRPASAVTLIAVTKTHGPELVRAAAVAGIRDVGENRVQEAEVKIPAVAHPGLRWHLIGHLQRNKARRAAELFDMIHSIDSVELAASLSRYAAGRQGELEVFAQVNVAGEASKSGFDPAMLPEVAPRLGTLPHLRWRGLMTIAPEGASVPVLRALFAATRELCEQLAGCFDPGWWNALSMGMSDDFEIAIEEGATHVRVGRALFGARTVGAQP